MSIVTNPYLLSVLGIILIAYLIKKYRTYRRVNMTLSDKFDDLIEWQINDRVVVWGKSSYRGEWDNIILYVVMFDEQGVWASERYISEFEREEYFEKGKFLDKKELQFIPTYNIKLNKSLKKRKAKLQLKSKLMNSTSFHKRLVEMQQEYQTLMEQEIEIE